MVVEFYEDDDKYREERQRAYRECCTDAYCMVAEALRHLGVIGGDNHDVIHAKLGDQLDQFSDDQREAIEKLQKAGDLLIKRLFMTCLLASALSGFGACRC